MLPATAPTAGRPHAVGQTDPMEGYHASTYGDRWADVYDDWYGEDEQIEPTVAFLAALAGDPVGCGTLIELGIGTGRIALPLAALGYDVRGIDASEAMVDRLRAKPMGASIPVVIGDMGAVPVPPVASGLDGHRVTGVFVAYNTFFGLASDEAQRSCLTRIAGLLDEDGWFVTASFVPGDGMRGTSGSDVGVRTIDADRVVLTADVHDAEAQTISGQYIDISTAGIALRPFHLRYLYPAQLDELATAAGLHLADRWATWDREPFDDDSPGHVSVYRRAR